MPGLPRETVLNALYALVSTSSSFNYTGRRLMFWTEQIEQPALFMRYIGDERMPLQAYGIPQETILKVEAWIYVKSGTTMQDPADYPELYITPLLDALDEALNTNTTFDGRQTLGLEGYVTHAWIEGETTVAQGEQDSQAIMIVPIRVQVNAQIGVAAT